jgi:hypothetical protein
VPELITQTFARPRPFRLNPAKSGSSGAQKTPHIAAGRFTSDFHCLKHPCIDAQSILHAVTQFVCYGYLTDRMRPEAVFAAYACRV